jgi:hypothetical protein
MRISKKTKNWKKSYFKLLKTRSYLKKILISFFIIIFSFSLIYFGYFFSFRINQLKKFINNFELSAHVESYFIEIPHIDIDISHEKMEELRYSRQNAIKKGILVDNVNTVSGDVSYNGRKMEAKFRLKGNNVDHWLDDEKFSLKIKIKGDNTLFGMKEFSIMDPARRKYLSEWYYQKYLQFSNLIYHRYDFINVNINGKNLGVYAIDEGLDHRLLENNKLREGPILSINDDFFWKDFIYFGRDFYQKNYWVGDVKILNLNKIKDDTIKLNRAYYAKNLLESYREGKIKADKVFNIEKTAKLFAISDLFGQTHPLASHNVRFYYNPVSNLLEPIATDVFDLQIIDKLCYEFKSVVKSGEIQTTWELGLFKNNIFVSEYIKALNEISNEKKINAFFQFTQEDAGKNKAILSGSLKTSFLYNFNSLEILNKNQTYIRNALNPIKAIRSRIIKKTDFHDNIYLELANTQVLPIECLNVLYKDSIISTFTNNILTGKLENELIDFKTIKLPNINNLISSDSIQKDLKLKYRYLGSDKILYETINTSGFDYFENIVTSDPNIKNIEYLTVDEEKKNISFKNGKWTIKEDLIIPIGYNVTANSKLELDMINSSMIKSYSPVHFIGNEDDQIIISSSDSTGQGLLVLNTSQQSTLNHVNFSNLSNPSRNDLILTGAITFYEADVLIKNCVFSNNIKGDDFLNIFRSKFNITNSSFNDILADAFDSDFCIGKVSNTSFVDIGNDAIDISGTNININKILIDGVKDKGLSAGENSKIIASGIEIVNSEIAICSKDNSEVSISNLTLQNNKIGFCAFQKKPEFGPANINVSSLIINNVEIPYLIEKSSYCFIDGKIKTSNNNKIKDILYGVKYGKSSK